MSVKIPEFVIFLMFAALGAREVFRPVNWSSGISKYQVYLRKGLGWQFLIVGPASSSLSC